MTRKSSWRMVIAILRLVAWAVWRCVTFHVTTRPGEIALFVRWLNLPYMVRRMFMSSRWYRCRTCGVWWHHDLMDARYGGGGFGWCSNACSQSRAVEVGR